ncbi:MAG: hypothetical protein OER85_10460 [Gammaproteobacteria bacterium]|nr:hypothetical protein [Gammaproteobacteria bacterium]
MRGIVLWLPSDNDSVDLCAEDPGKDVHLYLNAEVRTTVEVRAGELDLRIAGHDKRIEVRGLRQLIPAMPDGFVRREPQQTGRPSVAPSGGLRITIAWF